ncbi:hypothetical protein Hanom_Chr16g01497021 [Helianthus anomalus]
MNKYAKRFVISGLKLRRTSFDTWMTFAAKLGDDDSEWPLEVIKSRKDEGKMVLAAGLQEDIPAMIDNLSGLGVETNIKMDDLTKIPF